MKAKLAAFASGTLFAAGLVVSGMVLPEKVVGFLDVTGDWDPSLMFVMVGAILVHFVLYRLIRRRPAPWFDATFHVPTRRDLDPRLLVGAVVFGAGWGLGGFCPGPGLVTAASGSVASAVFVIGMTGGMILEHTVSRAKSIREKSRA